MKPQGFGVILATSSMGGLQGGLAQHPYCTAKAAIVGFTKNLAAELGPFGVRACAIAPGSQNTPMMADVIHGDPDDLNRSLEFLERISPLKGRPGLAEDIAEAAVWLASDAAGYVSGHTLVVDGGLTTGSVKGAKPGSGPYREHKPLLREGGKRGIA